MEFSGEVEVVMPCGRELGAAAGMAVLVGSESDARKLKASAANARNAPGQLEYPSELAHSISSSIAHNAPACEWQQFRVLRTGIGGDVVGSTVDGPVYPDSSERRRR